MNDFWKGYLQKEGGASSKANRHATHLVRGGSSLLLTRVVSKFCHVIASKSIPCGLFLWRHVSHSLRVTSLVSWRSERLAFPRGVLRYRHVISVGGFLQIFGRPQLSHTSFIFDVLYIPKILSMSSITFIKVSTSNSFSNENSYLDWFRMLKFMKNPQLLHTNSILDCIYIDGFIFLREYSVLIQIVSANNQPI